MPKYDYEEFEFFWTNQHPFSQWHNSGFTIGKRTYNCAEQYMMHQKAVLFGDQGVAKQIMRTSDPRKQKAYGRKVRGFKKRTWEKNRLEIVFRGNYAKFTQNENLKKFLLKTKGKWIVEASPLDFIWGIGLAKEDPKAQFPEEWPGLNLLGDVLMRVRTAIENE